VVSIQNSYNTFLFVDYRAEVNAGHFHGFEDLFHYDEAVEAVAEEEVHEDKDGVELDPGELQDLEHAWRVDDRLVLRHIDDEVQVYVVSWEQPSWITVS
jgi:hypothetical protein